MCFSFFQCFYKHLFLLNDGVYDTIPQSGKKAVAFWKLMDTGHRLPVVGSYAIATLKQTYGIDRSQPLAEQLQAMLFFRKTILT